MTIKAKAAAHCKNERNSGRAMRYEYTILDGPEIEQIHQVSLRVLADAGMKVYDSQLCDRLAGKGLDVDRQSQVVRFPPEPVEEALKSAPGVFSVRDHLGNVLTLRNGTTLPSVYENAVKVWDWNTKTVRPSTLADLRICTKLADAVPEIRIACPACLPGDLPQADQMPVSIRTLLENSTKANLVAPHDRSEAELWLEAAAIADQNLADSEDSSLVFVASPTSPLQIDRDTCSIMQIGIERGIPLLLSSCPMAGTTSPATMAGTTALTHAEFLGMLTISQLLRPGSPAIYGGSAGPVDLRYGALSYGAPERNTMLCANIDLANHFQLPHFSSAGSVDSAFPDFQTGQAKALTWLTRLMKKTILGIWFGGLLTGSAIAPEQIILDADLYRAVLSMLEGMKVDEERLAYEAICRVGPGGSYLMDEHTLNWMRKGEYYHSTVINMQGEHGAAMVDRAHEEVETMLANHQPSVSPSVRDDLRRLFENVSAGQET